MINETIANATEKDLKHLNRSDLIMLIFRQKQKENELQLQIEMLEKQLSDRQFSISQAGSIAEAVVGLNQVFETAQKTADEYLLQIRQLKTETDSRCSRMLADAISQSKTMIEQAENESQVMKKQAELEVTDKWNAFSDKVDQVLRTHAELSSLISSDKCSK